jgi:hypothetical protein
MRKSEPKEQMIPHEIPELPWAKVGCDLFKFKGKDYLLCVDYYSKYPDIVLLPATTSYSVIAALSATFARFGVPKQVISDNGPQFSSREFREFAERFKFKHTTSSPGYLMDKVRDIYKLSKISKRKQH